MNETKYTFWLQVVAYGALFAMPFLAFVVSDSLFFPFITGKNLGFRLIAEIGFAAWILLALYDPTYRPKRSWFIGILCLLVVWMGVTTITALDPLRAFWSTLERMEGYVTLLHLGMYAITLAGMLRSQVLWDRYLMTSAGVSVAIALYGVQQIMVGIMKGEGVSRIDLTLGNPTYLAIYMLFHIFITALLMHRMWKHVWVRWVGALAIVLQTYILTQTGTRGAMLGLIGGAVVVALALAIFERNRPRVRKWAIGGIAVIVLLVGGFIALKDTETLQNVTMFRRLSQISLEDDTTQARLTIWQNISWEGLKERPIVGWGFDNFNAVFNKYYDPSLYNQEQWFDRSHNVLFDWAIAGGLVGLVLYCGLFGALLWMMWRPNSRLPMGERVLLTGALAAYTIHNVFVFDNVMSYIVFAVVAGYIHYRSTEGDESLVVASQWQPSSSAHYVAGVFVPLLLVIGVYSMMIRPTVAAHKVLMGLKVGTGSVQVANPNPFPFFEESIAVGPFATKEVLSQMYQFGTQVYEAESVDDEAKSLIDARIRELSDREYARAPEAAARLLFFYGLYLDGVSDHVAAEETLRTAISLSPHKQSMHFALINTLISQNRFSEALAIAQEVFEMEPRFDDARSAYAIMLLQVGDRETAFELVNVSDYNPSDRLINLAIQLGDYELVALMWKSRVVLFPDEIQPRASYAATLDQMGNTEGALAVLRQGIIDLPEYADQFEAMVEQVEAR